MPSYINTIFNHLVIKKQSICFFTIMFIGMSFSSAQTIAIPDANFENYLETHSADGALVNVGDANSMGDGIANNGLVLTARITDVLLISVNNLNINNLTGIENFTSLETLICNSNNLTTLDVSANTNLKALLCGLNQLTNLDIRSNGALEVLDCSSNQITSLILQESNVAGNPLLERLTCSNNRLTSIDVSENSNLTSLAISSNQLSGELIVSNNVNLESLFCASNKIATLDLSANTNLKTFDASNNLITTLNLSTINTVVCPDPQTDPLTVCQAVSSINVSNNQLVSLNLVNGFNDLITSFSSEDNPDLFCIQLDSGFTPPSGWIKDDWTYYGETACTDIFTYVPDDNFETYLETNGLGDNTANNNFVLTSNITNLTILDVSGNNIENLTGIEDFVDLENLDCSDNNLKSLNLTNNAALLELNCSNNILPPLDLSANVLITTLNCSSQIPYTDPDDASKNYSFNNLDVNSNTALLNLNCSGNTLTSLYISSNLLLTDLDCSLNQIKILNVSANTELINLYCNDNSLLALNIKNGNNGALGNFNAQNNANLFCIEVDNVANANASTGWTKDVTASYNVNCGTYVPDNAFENYLEANGLGDGIANNNFVLTASVNAFTGPLNISGLGISDLTGIEAFIALQDLNCSDNDLTRLDLSNNTALTILNCSENKIENLDLSLNTLLVSLTCNDNESFFTLNIKNGNNTNLTTFNATNNANLFCINVDNAILGSIPASWQKDTIASYNDDCDNNRYTAIPDGNFEQALVDLGVDTLLGDNQVLTSNIEHLLSLDVSNKQIQSLEGIKGFSLLQELDCSGNYLNDLDVSDMANLQDLYCGSNYFLTNNIANTNGLLNTTGTTSLTKLFCADNNLSDLNISQNANLEALDCSNNNLTDLDISNNLILEELNCNSNQISNLSGYITDNTTLKKVSCNNNELSTLLVNRYLALTDLNCRSNALTQLDITSNSALEILDFSDNDLTDINLSGKTNLISVSGSQNQLIEVDDLSSAFLESLIIDNNQISQLTTVLNNLPAIKYLSISNNQLADLNAINNTNLIELNVSNNALTNLQLSGNLNQLKTFNCNNNLLTDDMDLSTMGTAACPPQNQNNPLDFCPDAISINVSNNQLEFVNIQNGVNNNISIFSATGNPDLTCIQVDDVNNIGSNWQKDVTAKYRIDCRFGETYVPDNNFEQALMDDVNINVDPILDDYVPTAIIETLTNLDINGKNISDLTGIEDFIALQNLNCSDNDLSTVDLSKNINLIEIDCSNNVFSVIDFTENTALITINCSDNMLSDLDLIANTNVTNLNISNNTFSEFNPSNIPTLQILNCDVNQLVDLDFSMNASLTELRCASNQLESLNIKNGQNPNLVILDAQNNPNLTCIQTDTGAIPGGVNWLKDTTAEYLVSCHFGETYVPDDAFEQALINDGLDSSRILDDYVPTSEINSILSLSVNGEGILDLTGIEDFIGLTSLNFEENGIVSVDLSNNILITTLNASKNEIATIDVSALSDLRQLDISNNVLTEINLDSNLSLLDVNVSNNMLSVLDVDLLVDLQKLDCSANQLVALDVTSNPNLTDLFCYSNAFIQDRLNLQNGSNITLARFSATDNPTLSCILVDDPFTVITNADGTYDNWFKDASSSYQSVCDDADNDGIANADDLCPGTPFGEPVDLFGCPFLSLANDNFTVLITGETCLNNNDGKINIKTKELYNYKANLTKEGFDRVYSFTNEIDIKNLLAGTYELCITVEEWPNFVRCFKVVINHPENLEVITGKSDTGKEVSFDMAGNSSYNIDFNGLKFTTNDSQITLQLEAGKNSIKISTDLRCQGVHEETILISDDMFVYPNPFQNDVNIHLGAAEKDIKIDVYSYLGQLVYSKTITNRVSRSINIDTNVFASGLYTVLVQSNKSVSTLKIVKK